MDISVHDSGDRAELDRLIRTQTNAKQRDRYRAVRLALDGHTKTTIQRMLGRSKDFVERWCYRYRDQGMDALVPGTSTGRPPTLPRDQEWAFKQRVLAGPTEADGVCTLRGREVVRILEEEFGVSYSLDGAYDLLHRLGCSCLKPRPQHRKNDPQVMAEWVERAPLFVQDVQEAHPHKKVEVWFQDEARFGQQGTLTRVWAERGTRPQAVKQTEYEWVYLFGAINPVTGNSSALITPTVNTQYMNAHLRFISDAVDDQTHVVLVLDRAGWHVAKALEVPENITLLHLPPYSPELNPVERVWAYVKSHYMSNRIYIDYDELFAATTDAWNKIDDTRFQSLTHTATFAPSPAAPAAVTSPAVPAPITTRL